MPWHFVLFFSLCSTTVILPTSLDHDHRLQGQTCEIHLGSCLVECESHSLKLVFSPKNSHAHSQVKDAGQKQDKDEN